MRPEQKPAGYVQRDPRPVKDIGRSLLRGAGLEAPKLPEPDLEDLYPGYEMGPDGVFRVKGSSKPSETTSIHHVEVYEQPDPLAKPLTDAESYQEGRKIIQATLYIGTSPEKAGDTEILRELR